ncbi:TPA: hypothetical protein ACGBIE_003983 [Yersinia enterocolitica]
MRTLLLLWVLMMGLLAWHAHNLKKELDSAKLVIGTLSAGIESRDNAITRLQDEARQQAGITAIIEPRQHLVIVP